MIRTFVTATTAVVLVAGLAHAKGHDQSGTLEPGASVGAETVAAAKTLGAALGNGQKPDTPDGGSGDAGNPGPQ